MANRVLWCKYQLHTIKQPGTHTHRLVPKARSQIQLILFPINLQQSLARNTSKSTNHNFPFPTLSAYTRVQTHSLSHRAFSAKLFCGLAKDKGLLIRLDKPTMILFALAWRDLYMSPSVVLSLQSSPTLSMNSRTRNSLRTCLIFDGKMHGNEMCRQKNDQFSADRDRSWMTFS